MQNKVGSNESSGEEKVLGVNWSPFLIRFLTKVLLILFLPHLLFWIPYWIQLIVGDLGWILNNSTTLPSVILNVLYGIFDVIFLLWTTTLFDYKFNRWPFKVESDQITFERIRIPLGGGHFLEGDIAKSPSTPDKNAPVLIVCHGLGGQRSDFYAIGIPAAFQGFAVLFYDSRGHGETTYGKKWDTAYIIRDLSRVIDYIETRAIEKGDLNPGKIVAWGASMGGGIVLNEGYLDHRIDFIIALCTWADFKMTATRPLHNFTEELVKAGYEFMGVNLNPSDLQNRMVSPTLYSFHRKKGWFGHPVWWEVDNEYRVVLAHCKDDQVIQYENFEINKKMLGLPPRNYIAFEKGNHAFAGVETALIGKMMLWFWERGY
ncbi:MAG: alpha/beta hydrolase [Promethearchaeota archaeon]